MQSAVGECCAAAGEGERNPLGALWCDVMHARRLRPWGQRYLYPPPMGGM